VDDVLIGYARFRFGVGLWCICADVRISGATYVAVSLSFPAKCNCLPWYLDSVSDNVGLKAYVSNGPIFVPFSLIESDF
jgi:hypothetical protein